MTFKKVIVRAFIVLFLLMLVLFGLIYIGVIQVPISGNELNMAEKREKAEELIEFNAEDVIIEHPDADAYYKNNAEIITTVEVDKSDKVQTESDVMDGLEKRGFGSCSIWSEYTMEGEYSGSYEVAGAPDKHPIYQTYYISSNNELWTIIIINGSVMANPVSFNMQSGLNAQVIFSETEIITSYDSVTNKFYETIPNDSELIVKVVEQIDAETLDSLTIEGINGYDEGVE